MLEGLSNDSRKALVDANQEQLDGLMRGFYSYFKFPDHASFSGKGSPLSITMDHEVEETLLEISKAYASALLTTYALR